MIVRVQTCVIVETIIDYHQLSWTFERALSEVSCSRAWARSIRPKIPVWISEIFACRMERYFPPGRTDLFLFPLEHIFHQELLSRQNAEGSWWSGCLKCHKLLHVETFNTHSEFSSSLIFTWPTQTCVMKETYQRFSQESMQTGWTDQQEIRKDQSTIFQAFKNRFELRQIILHPVLASVVWLERLAAGHLVVFHD